MPEFTSDWVGGRMDLWLPHMKELVGQPIRVLEIGTYEARSAIWIAQNIATDPMAQVWSIDDHSLGKGVVARRALANVRELGLDGKIWLVNTSSYQYLTTRWMPYELIYIDGDHRGRAVMEDSCLAWRLLKLGGYLVWDDYGYAGKECQLPERLPAVAIDAFLECYASQLRVLHQGYQVIVRKTARS